MFIEKGEKVICSGSYKCSDKHCEHKNPHEIEHWTENELPMDCTMIDNCNGREICCEPVCSFIDFNIDGDFELL